MRLYHISQGQSSKGGDVLDAVKESLPSKLIPSPQYLEVMMISIYSRNPITLCTAYLPHNSCADVHAQLLSYLSSLVQPSVMLTLILVSNFNVPDINWSSLIG